MTYFWAKRVFFDKILYLMLVQHFIPNVSTTVLYMNYLIHIEESLGTPRWLNIMRIPANFPNKFTLLPLRVFFRHFFSFSPFLSSSLSPSFFSFYSLFPWFPCRSRFVTPLARHATFSLSWRFFPSLCLNPPNNALRLTESNKIEREEGQKRLAPPLQPTWTIRFGHFGYCLKAYLDRSGVIYQIF